MYFSSITPNFTNIKIATMKRMKSSAQLVVRNKFASIKLLFSPMPTFVVITYNKCYFLKIDIEG